MRPWGKHGRRPNASDTAQRGREQERTNAKIQQDSLAQSIIRPRTCQPNCQHNKGFCQRIPQQRLCGCAVGRRAMRWIVSSFQLYQGDAGSKACDPSSCLVAHCVPIFWCRVWECRVAELAELFDRLTPLVRKFENLEHLNYTWSVFKSSNKWMLVHRSWM
jgi:hypothetical protein